MSLQFQCLAETNCGIFYYQWDCNRTELYSSDFTTLWLWIYVVEVRLQRQKIIHSKCPFFLCGGCNVYGTTLKMTAPDLFWHRILIPLLLRCWSESGEHQQLGQTTQDPWTGDLWILVQNVTSPFNQERLFSSGLCIKKYNDAYSLIIGKGWHLNSLWVPAITLHLSNSFPIETDSCSGCLTLLFTFLLILRGLKSLESYSQANFVIHWNSPFASS